jgi:hypothetical protein
VRRVGQARRRDVVEGPIVKALRQIGADVTPISGKGAPDLLVRFRGHLWALEVKSKGGQRTEAQEATQWPIVRSVDEALVAIGARLRETTGADD